MAIPALSIPQIRGLKLGFKTGIVSGSYGNTAKGAISDFLAGGNYATNYGIGETTLRRALVTKSAAVGSAAQELGFDRNVLDDDEGTVPDESSGGGQASGALLEEGTPRSVSKVLYST